MNDAQMNLREAMLGNILCKHPQLANEIEEMLLALPVQERGRVMQSITRHPAGVNLGDLYKGADKPKSIELLSADMLLETEFPEPVWAVPGLLPVGLSILAGAPKVGKSWLALQLALAVASGGYFFGQRIEKGAILYLALEDPPRRLKDRMLAQNWPKGLQADFMPLGQFEYQIGNITNGGGEKLAHEIEDKCYRLVVIDTLSRSIPGDQQEVESMTRALTPIQEMSHQTNCTVILIDHHRKGKGFSPDVIADILGSTAKGGMADTAWGLYRERGKSGAKLAITGRDIEEKSLSVKMDWNTKSWQLEDEEITPQRLELLDALEDIGPVSVSEFAEALDRNRGNVYKQLVELEAQGKARKVEKLWSVVKSE